MSTESLRAADPNAAAEELQELAYQHPELQAQIAENPAAYRGLLEWISEHGTDAGRAAANQRLGADDSTVMANRRVESEVDGDSDATVLSPRHTDATESAVDLEEVTEEDATAFETTEETVLSSRVPDAPMVAPAPVLPSPFDVPAVPFTAPEATRTLPNLPPPGSAPPQVPPMALPPVASVPPTPPPAQPASGPRVLLGALAGILIGLLVAVGAWFLVIQGNVERSADERAESAAAKAAEEATREAEQAAQERAKQAEEERAERERTQEQNQVTPTPNEEPADQVRFPAPANAVNAPWFISPSGNIACQLDAEGAVCTIYEADFNLSAPGCTSAPYTIIADAVSSRWDCTLPVVPNDANGPVLEYSTASTSGSAACNSTSRGMSCWDTVSGSSFALARAGFMISGNGVIPETEYPWR